MNTSDRGVTLFASEQQNRVTVTFVMELLILYYILARIGNAFPFPFAIKDYELSGMSDDMQRTTLVTQG